MYDSISSYTYFLIGLISTSRKLSIVCDVGMETVWKTSVCLLGGCGVDGIGTGGSEACRISSRASTVSKQLMPQN